MKEGNNNDESEDDEDAADKNTTATTAATAVKTPAATVDEDAAKTPTPTNATNGSTSTATNGVEAFKNKKNKKTGFNNMALTPADILPNIDNILTKGDKAKAKEKAYDIVEEKLGKNNLQSMDMDTKELIERQKGLMEEMKKITPILTQTMGMVGNMDLSSLTSMFDKVSGMLPDTK